MRRMASSHRVADLFAKKKGLREAWFPDWSPDREENPNGIRDVIDYPVPLLHDESRKFDRLRTALPGTEDDPNVTAYDYHENPYSNMPPWKVRKILEDPDLSPEMRRRAREAIENFRKFL